MWNFKGIWRCKLFHTRTFSISNEKWKRYGPSIVHRRVEVMLPEGVKEIILGYVQFEESG